MLAEVGLFKLVVSRQVLDETERNLRKKLPRALPVFADIMARLNLDIVPDPPSEASAYWEAHIETKDAPILAAAIAAKADRLLTLNTKDFTSAVAEESGLIIQTPAEFMQTLRTLVSSAL
jgi:predicted nucleic acid-binding protein